MSCETCGAGVIDVLEHRMWHCSKNGKLRGELNGSSVAFCRSVDCPASFKIKGHFRDMERQTALSEQLKLVVYKGGEVDD